ncbi:MAG: MFS transporter [Cellulosilyticaceae bacterium]
MNRYIEKKWYPYLIWAVVALVYVIVFFHRVSTGAVRQEVLSDFGLLDSPQGGSLFALLGSMYMYAYMLMQVPTGILADTLGPKKTIVGGTFLAAIGSIVFGVSPNMAVAFLGRFIVGIGVSVTFVCILKIISDYFPKEKFATMSGVTSFVGNMGSLLALTPLVLMTEAIGWRQVFIVIGGISVLMAVLCWIMIKEKTQPIKVSNEPKEAIGKVLKQMIKNKKLYPPMIVFALTFGATITLTANWGVTLLQDVYGVEKVAATNVLSMITLGVAIGCMAVGRLSDMMKSYKKPMILFGSIHLVCWVLFTTGLIPFGMLYILFFVLGFTGTSFIVGWGYAKEQYPPQYSGMAMSMINFAGFLGAAFVPQIIGAIYDMLPKSDLKHLWQIALIVLTVCVGVALVSILMLKENDKKRD